MFNIREFTVEKIVDPFGIIAGDRYEFILYIDADEEDELFNENGIYFKALFDGEKILQYSFYEDKSNKGLDFALEDDEEAFLLTFFKENVTTSEE